MQEENESAEEVALELLGPTLVEPDKEDGPKKWRVIAFTYDPPLIGYGPTLWDALDQATGQIAFKKV
jgi:hypothetical protein